MSTLLIIDGTAFAYRAFYAIANLSTHDGRPTNAVYGFIRMCQQLRDIWRPDRMLAVFDGGLPRARVERLPTYKAQRDPMPDALRGQFAGIEEYLGLAGIRHLRIEGEEADDVMASYARLAVTRGADALLATSDKDLFQLVDDRVSIVPPTKMEARMGPAEVRAKTGVEPAQIVAWQALIGDTVDNIPGIPGIGPKTAADLLNRFGSLDEIWKRLEEIPSDRIRRLLRENRELVERNTALMKLRTDLPCPIGLDDLIAAVPDPARLAPFFERMEFHSLLKAESAPVGKAPRKPKPTPPPPDSQLSLF